MKKIMILLIVVIQFGVFSQTATPPSAGDGTIKNPYQIASLNNLYWIAASSSRWDKYYIQTADIDASATRNWFGGAGWLTIGNSTTIFSGVYSGYGNKLSGLYINRPSTNYIGLFGNTYYAKISDIKMENVEISGNACSGGISGKSENSTISNCSVTGTIHGTYYVGGITGYNQNSTITQSEVSVSVSGTGTVGGLAGLSYSNSSIIACSSTSNVDAPTYAGGLTGYNNISTISNSYSLSKVTGTDYVGGLAGNHVAGGTVSNCYSAGSVTGSTYTGGLIGNNSGSTVTNSFWDTETSGQSTSAGGSGKTTAEMKTLSTFTNSGWDFTGETINGADDIFDMNLVNNDGYPFFTWQFNIPFTEIYTGLPQLYTSSVAWGDYDNDGDLDIILSGYDGSNKNSRIFRNEAGVFIDINAGLIGVQIGDANWGDYDNDGDLDLFLTGFSGTNTNPTIIAKIYRNDGNDIFTDINAGLDGITYSTGDWGDFDNDGDLDLILSGYTSSYTTIIYRNDRNDIFSNIDLGIPSGGFVKWLDYDNDGDLDILLTGNANNYIADIYRNDNGTFTNISAGLTSVRYGSSALADYDNDGDLDILLTGYNGTSNISRIYRNDAGVFIGINAEMTGISSSSADWRDYDNDGDPDILISGYTGTEFITKIYRNDFGEFKYINAFFIGVRYGTSDWVDYDNDGDLDVFITGDIGGNNYISKLYRNDASISNNTPNIPINLTETVTGSDVIFSWDKAADIETPQDGLSYNIFIGVSNNKSKIKSSMSETETGYRKIVNIGNAGQVSSYALKNLPDGRYCWAVQSIDHNDAGSVFSEEMTFDIGIVPDPPPAPVALDDTELTESGFTAVWESASGAEGYFIDIAFDESFTNFVPGYENKDLGDVNSYKVTGLNTVNAHYYRIRAYNYIGVSGYSNVITVQRESIGTVTLNSPLGGEVFNRGGLVQINWSGNISENVKIEIYKYDDFLDCISESTPSDGSFTWSIPLSLYGEFFKIRITSVLYSYIYDISDGYFLINQNQNDAKLLEEQTYSWNSTIIDWNEFPSKKIINYNGDLVDSWEYQYYVDSLGVYVTSKTYECTYYTDHYRLVNFYYQWIDNQGGGSDYYDCETTYRYSLANIFEAKYIHETYFWGQDFYNVITDKIYTYVDGLIDNVYDHYVWDGVSISQYKTYYTYDIYDRLFGQNYYNYMTSEMLERTYLVYFSGEQRRAEVLTEKKDGSSWINKSKRTLSYDSSDRLRRNELFNWTNYVWQQSSIDSSYYYDDGTLKRTVHLYYNSTEGIYKYSNKIDFIYDDTSLKIEPDLQVSDYKLLQNCPNPFNPITTISYALPHAAQVELNVYNLNGQLVQSLENGKMGKGVHKAEFNGADLTSGMYICNLKVDGKSVQSKKMMMLK